MKKTKRKVAAFLLAVGMSLTSIPMSAYAQEVQEPSNQEQESQEVVQEEQAESVEEQETVTLQKRQGLGEDRLSTSIQEAVV